LVSAAIIFALVAAASAAGGGQSETSGRGENGPAEQAAQQAAEQAARKGGLEVFVSIQPQKYFVERVAGPQAEVSVMVPPGKEPHNYEPTPRQVSRLSAADIYFRIGVPFEEAFIPRIERSLEELPVVDVSRDVERRRLDTRSADGQGAEDPHVWLGPVEVKKIAAVIRDALSELVPERASTYSENYRTFASEIDALHEQLSRELAPLEGETMFVFHPAFGYFADTYGLDQQAVEIGGNEPSARQLQEIIERAQTEGVQVIFVQPQFSKASAEQIAGAIDGAVIPIDPLAEDWMDNMRTIADRIREGMQ
jgi:zinc transport system substrate-binding protein